MSTKRKCITCGKEYEYCPTCGRFNSLPKWMCNWDSQECKDVFEVLTMYYMDDAKKEDVQTVLDLYGVKSYAKFVPSIRKQLDEILAKKTKKSEEI